MASQTQEWILATFREVSGSAEGAGPATDALGDLSSALKEAANQIAGAGVAQTAATTRNTSAVPTAVKSTGTSPDSGGGVTAGRVATTILKSGFGLVPLVAGLAGLFGGGSDEEPPPLIRYAAPAPLRLEGAQWGDAVSEADYDQAGRLRPVTGRATGGSATAPPVPPTAELAGVQTAPTITVQVQAMDSRSFIDHSQEIARAVRDAMLNLNAINDVVNDL